MFEEKAKPKNRLDLIAMPPLKMTLAHAKDVRVSKVALVAAIRKISLQPVVIEMKVDRQTVKRLITYLEKNR